MLIGVRAEVWMEVGGDTCFGVWLEVEPFGEPGTEGWRHCVGLWGLFGNEEDEEV